MMELSHPLTIIHCQLTVIILFMHGCACGSDYYDCIRNEPRFLWVTITTVTLQTISG